MVALGRWFRACNFPFNYYFPEAILILFHLMVEFMNLALFCIIQYIRTYIHMYFLCMYVYKF